VAPKNLDREARAARQRLRDYQARQQMHTSQTGRRKRDNVIAGVVVTLVFALAIGAQLLYFNGGPGSPVASPSATAEPTASPTATASGQSAPAPALAENRTWAGTMTLNGIPLGLELSGTTAPQGVANFISLTDAGFYNGVTCHRLTTATGFAVLQCGDPKGDGTGGPGYTFGPIENAPTDNLYPAGTIAMARQGGNASSMGSQFFIVYKDTTIPADAAGGYTVLGKVTSGLDSLISEITDKGTLDGSSDGQPAVPVTISSITLN
jgi:peptidyl-prolyl cis-trans isomerase B (cyclophilin B)